MYRNLLIIASIFLLISGFQIHPRVTPRVAPPTMDLAIVVHPKNPVDKLSLDEIRRLWLKKTVWGGRINGVTPVDRSLLCPERTMFYRKILKMTEDEVVTYFLDRQYNEGEEPQKKFTTDAEVMDFISNTKNAIGYVNLSSIGIENVQKVKIVYTISQ